MKYSLNNNVRIIQRGSIITFRKGLWDYNEASIDINELNEDVALKLCKLVTDLWNGQDIDDEEYEELKEVIDGLYYGEFLLNADEKHIREDILKILLGNMSYQARRVENPKKVLLVTDSNYIEKIAIDMSKEIGLELDILDKDMIFNIMHANLTQKLDALSRMDTIKKYGDFFKDYSAIAVCQYRLNILFLRNINEVCIENGTQLIISALDGPFVHMTALKPPKTADFDSLEQRILARLEDHTLYRDFTNIDVHTRCKENKAYIPILTLLLSMCISEAYLVSNIGSSKFEGRLLSIYIPTLEIQVQDILKIPTSNAMGNLAKTQYKDNQVEARKIINQILKNRR